MTTPVGRRLRAAAWWLALSVAVSLLRSRLRPRWLQLANRVSGAGIALFGLLVLMQLR